MLNKIKYSFYYYKIITNITDKLEDTAAIIHNKNMNTIRKAKYFLIDTK